MRECFCYTDLDGCLVIPEKVKVPGTFNRAAVRNLNKIIQETGAKIIVSSSWRMDYSLEELNQLFREEGIVGEVVGITKLPECVDGWYLAKTRGAEILEHVEENGIENWVAIEDCLSVKVCGERAILCDFDYGLTEELANKAIGILKS